MSNRRRGRVGRNSFTTRSGTEVKLNRSLGERIRMRKDHALRSKAERLSGMPKSRLGRFFYRMHPKRLYRYWFSREGGIMALKVTGIGIIAGFLLLVGLFAYFRKDLPNLKDISGNNIGGSIQYYDRTGKTLLWEDYDAVKRIPIKEEQMPQNIKDATVAIEDKDFFKHGGFDVRGISRAAWSNAVGRSTQGGSTITQQLVKLTQNWTEERTVTRKVKELIIAVELERSYSKQEILLGYLNTAPYGGIEYGVEAAARDYFQKPAKKLTLAQSAMLAAIPKAPKYYSPYSASFDREALIGRQHYILDLMQQQGMITAKQRDAAKKEKVLKAIHKREPKFKGVLAPWFVLTAKQQLEDQFASKTGKIGGWKVTTTLDLNLQRKAEEKVKAGINQVYAQGGDTAAFAAEDITTGQVVSLVGGIDFENKQFGQVNYATEKLPPGSSFKPYDYSALIEHHDNFGAGSVLYDTQGKLDGYPCTNKALPRNGGNCLQDYDFRYPGPVTIRYALGGSRNVPAVKAMLITGIDKTIDTAEKLMGNPSQEDNSDKYNCYADDNLTKSAPCYASSSIGDGAYLRLTDHIHGQASLARLGKNIPQTFILKVENSESKPLYQWKKEKPAQVIRPDTAFIINDILADSNASYFPAGNKPQIGPNGWKFAMKTGTTNDGKDGWMTGYSTKYAASVWVGYHTRRVQMSGFMETMTQPIWQGWMQEAHQNVKPKYWDKPSGVKSAPAYVIRSHVGLGSVEPSPANDLYPSWYKNTKKKSTSKRTIDIVSNKVATECTPTRARKTLSETDATSFSGDIFVDSGGNQGNQKDDVHKCSDKKPNINLSVQKKGSNTYNLIASVSQGTHPLSSEKFKGSISFSVGSTKLPGGTFTVTKPGTVVYKNYQPSFNGTRTVTATIIDSVLYDGSDSSSINGSASGGSISSFKITGSTSSSANLKWSVYSGATSYSVSWTKSGGGSGSCASPGSSTSTTCSSLPGSGTYTFTVQANGVGSPKPSATTSDDI